MAVQFKAAAHGIVENSYLKRSPLVPAQFALDVQQPREAYFSWICSRQSALSSESSKEAITGQQC
jgi:hypothetical protein